MTASIEEAELKLRAPDEAALDALAAAPSLGGAVLGPATVVHEVDVYLDTADGRLAAARWACRFRTREGRSWISLKGPATHDPEDALHRRPEVEGPVGEPGLPISWPESPAREMVLELAGEAALEERLSLVQERTERSVTDGAEPLGTLSLDRVEVMAGDRSAGRLRIVELELHPGASGDRADRHAARAGELQLVLEERGLVREPASKLVLALELVRAAQPPS